MTANEPASQQLTIHLLRMYATRERNELIKKAKELYLRNDSSAREQINLCYQLASELYTEPEKYNELYPLAQTILARQTKKHVSKITKVTIAKQMFTDTNLSPSSYSKTFNRLLNDPKIHKISYEYAKNLWMGFKEEHNQIFWKNQLYILFPYLATEDVSDGPVLNCLQAVWNAMDKEDRKSAYNTFCTQKNLFDQLEGTVKDVQAPKKIGLYDFLKEAWHEAGLTKERILEEIWYETFTLDPDTYRNYKKNWEQYETGKVPIPRNRMTRNHIFYFSIYLNMEYLTLVGMLAASGYSFRIGEPDETLARYYQGNRENKTKVLEYLASIIQAAPKL